MPPKPAAGNLSLSQTLVQLVQELPDLPPPDDLQPYKKMMTGKNGESDLYVELPPDVGPRKSKDSTLNQKSHPLDRRGSQLQRKKSIQFDPGDEDSDTETPPSPATRKRSSLLLSFLARSFSIQSSGKRRENKCVRPSETKCGTFPLYMEDDERGYAVVNPSVELKTKDGRRFSFVVADRKKQAPSPPPRPHIAGRKSPVQSADETLSKKQSTGSLKSLDTPPSVPNSKSSQSLESLNEFFDVETASHSSSCASQVTEAYSLDSQRGTPPTLAEPLSTEGPQAFARSRRTRPSILPFHFDFSQKAGALKDAHFIDGITDPPSFTEGSFDF